MKRKESIFNRCIMRCFKLLYVIANIAIFSTAIYFFSFHNWSDFDKIFTDEQILWYSIILTFSYSIVLLFLTRLYIAFRVGYLSKGNLIFCQTLSSLIAVVFAYLIFDCITLSFQNPIPFLGVLVAEFILSFIWSILATKLYFKITRPQNTILIYRGAGDLKRIEEAKQFAAYKIDKEIKISEETGKEIIEQLGGAEVVFLAGAGAALQNEIVTYCVENNIDCFLSLLIGNVIVSGGKHNQAFSTPIIGINRSSPPLEYLFIKRAFDIFVSILALIVASPIMLLTALAIRLYDKGPAIYKQERLTKDEKTFTLYKFRSMISDAEKDGVARLSTENDNRITPIGKIIRACRIDELPQLVNIFKGDMTIVGPRPERPDIAKQYLEEIPEFNLRLQVKAGLTGYAQVYGRYNTNPYDKLGMDLMYINKMSVFTDLKIMFYTVRILLMKSSTSGIESGQTTAFVKENENKTDRGDDDGAEKAAVAEVGDIKDTEDNNSATEQ